MVNLDFKGIFLLKLGLAIIASVATLFLMHIIFQVFAGVHFSIALFFVLLVCLILGGTPGLLYAAIVGLGIWYLYFEPYKSVGISNWYDLIRLISYFICASFMAFAVRSMQHTHKKIALSEQQFRAAFEQASIGIEMLDLKGNFLRGNNTLSTILGYSPDELNKLKFSDITLPEDLLKEQPLIDNLLSGRIPSYVIEKRYIRKNNVPVWVRVSASLVKTENPYRLSIIENIQQRKQTEQALQASERMFRKTFENALVGMTHVDLNGNWLLVNDTFCQMLGYSKEALINSEFSVVHPDDIQYDYTQYQQLAKGQIDNYFIEKRYIHKNGSIVWASIYRSLIRDQAGKPQYSSSVVLDITDRKNAQEQLLNLKDKLEDKNKELELIIGIVSHDLRSPLVNVKGFANEINKDCSVVKNILATQTSCRQALQKLSPVIEQAIPESIGFIESSATAMSNLVNALVEVARAGIAAVKPEILDMNQIIRQVHTSIEFKFKQQKVSYDIDPDLPSCLADKTQVTQIFTNLLDNAVKYLDENRPGQICVEGRIQGEYVLYWVADNGIGIADEDQTKIFNLYTQLHEKASEGVGMGLATVKRLVDRNNGKIWVISKKGNGSTFYVLLPSPQIKQ